MTHILPFRCASVLALSGYILSPLCTSVSSAINHDNSKYELERLMESKQERLVEIELDSVTQSLEDHLNRPTCLTLLYYLSLV